MGIRYTNISRGCKYVLSRIERIAEEPGKGMFLRYELQAHRVNNGFFNEKTIVRTETNEEEAMSEIIEKCCVLEGQGLPPKLQQVVENLSSMRGDVKGVRKPLSEKEFYEFINGYEEHSRINE
ncbi:hypothetical protein COU61_00325 [Candidatus Pacearchaeota archaeon CG10_big_fil_rev_8_21_14_0_10_35_13]|nr:MAG: hypothetical protein COU61_00325 [Candidatus Pacearchaeota archaeon CG10_big_fil_rev_8_21_14_0_10_35_13]